MADAGFIELDTTPPDATLTVARATAGEPAQIEYALSEPELTLALLILSNGHTLPLTVVPDSGNSGDLFADLPLRAPAAATVLMTVEDDLGNSQIVELSFRIRRVIGEIAVHTNGGRTRPGGALVRV